MNIVTSLVLSLCIAAAAVHGGKKISEDVECTSHSDCGTKSCCIIGKFLKYDFSFNIFQSKFVEKFFATVSAESSRFPHAAQRAFYFPNLQYLHKNARIAKG